MDRIEVFQFNSLIFYTNIRLLNAKTLACLQNRIEGEYSTNYVLIFQNKQKNLNAFWRVSDPGWNYPDPILNRRRKDESGSGSDIINVSEDGAALYCVYTVLISLRN